MKVIVKTPARLHLGLIDLNGNLGRMFGGLGVGIDQPNIIIEAQPAKEFKVTGKETELATQLTNRFLKAYQTNPNVHIHVQETIPAHSGLGSGTQFALAIATALAKLNGIKATVPQLAFAMERAKRTGVGTAIFEKGGFVVDGGKKTGETAGFPPQIYRQPFPTEWRFVIAVPNVNKGLSSSAETSAFNKLPPMPEGEVAKICRLTMLKLLPALAEKDIDSFGEALTAIQIVTGNHFAHVQGGTYSNKEVADTLEFIKGLGVHGFGQSSWGPAVYGIVKQEQAKPALKKLKAYLDQSFGGEAFIAKANNKGATIKALRD
ncbi:MAG: beta-ribofuranosylaminobenzene 5'-phosphate synthase family protein [Candidatus Bathyarchaeia archaeon]|jgi:beta-RFAP synthase